MQEKQHPPRVGSGLSPSPQMTSAGQVSAIQLDWQTGQHCLGGTTSSSPNPQIGLRHNTAEQSTERVYRTQEGGRGAVTCLCRLKALLTSTLNFLAILEEPGIAASTVVRHTPGIREANTRSKSTWVYQTVEWPLAVRAGTTEWAADSSVRISRYHTLTVRRRSCTPHTTTLT
jgi:hypothetical protein